MVDLSDELPDFSMSEYSYVHESRFLVAGSLIGLQGKWPGFNGLPVGGYDLAIVPHVSRFHEYYGRDLPNPIGWFQTRFPEIAATKAWRKSDRKDRIHVAILAAHLVACVPLLKPTGWLVLVCEPHLVRLLGIVLDELLDYHMTAAWEHRYPQPNEGTRHLAPCTHNILFYKMSDATTFNRVLCNPKAAYIAEQFDGDGGRWNSSTRPGRRGGKLEVPVPGAHPQDAGATVTHDPKDRGRRFAISTKQPGFKSTPKKLVENMNDQARIGHLVGEGDVRLASNGVGEPSVRQNGPKPTPRGDCWSRVSYDNGSVDFAESWDDAVGWIVEHTTRAGQHVLMPFVWDDDPPKCDGWVNPVDVGRYDGKTRHARAIQECARLNRAFTAIGHYSTFSLLHAHGIQDDLRDTLVWWPRWCPDANEFRRQHATARGKPVEAWMLDVDGLPPNPNLGPDGGIDQRCAVVDRLHGTQATAAMKPDIKHFARGLLRVQNEPAHDYHYLTFDMVPSDEMKAEADSARRATNGRVITHWPTIRGILERGEPVGVDGWPGKLGWPSPVLVPVSDERP
jgi:hypothetical protein